MLQQDTHIRSLEAEYSATQGARVLGRPFRFFESTDSTNSQAMRWAMEGAAEGSLVLAEHQTAGRGRHGRSWEDRPSSNLLFSIVLRPNLPPPKLGLITMAASLSLAETMDKFIAPLPVSIKWPNDLLVNGKKCSGMLVESAISTHNQHAKSPVILGIGVNINQEVFSASISEKTTSLLLEAGRHIPRIAFLSQFLLIMESRYFALRNDEHCEDNSNLLKQYQSRLAFLNEDTTMQFIGKNERVHGNIRGVTKTGALILQTQRGLQEFHAGEMTSRCD